MRFLPECPFMIRSLPIQVKDFWPRYWGGVVLLDRGMEFFKALGGGKLTKDSFISGFLFYPIARANYRRAKALGVDQSFKGKGEIKGGLFVLGSGKSGIAYQFIERNFGDWAPLAEVIEICTQLQVIQSVFGCYIPFRYGKKKILIWVWFSDLTMRPPQYVSGEYYILIQR